jgi:hypothetical protein
MLLPTKELAGCIFLRASITAEKEQKLQQARDLVVEAVGEVLPSLFLDEMLR